MPITRQKKEEIVAKAKDALAKAESVVFVNFHGLSVAETTQLRGGLREHGVGYMVGKKTLVKRALDDAKVEGELPALDGELALAYGEDLLVPAREVYAFQKDHEGKVSIIGGIFEGKYMDKEQMMNIATIPPREVLYAQFLNIINSPLQGLAIALDKIAEKKA